MTSASQASGSAHQNLPVLNENALSVPEQKTATKSRYPLPKAHHYGVPLVFGFPLPSSYVLRIGRQLGPPVPEGATEEEEEDAEEEQYREAFTHWLQICERVAPKLKVEVPQVVIKRKLYSFICFADNTCPARMKIPSQRVLDGILAELEREGCKTKPMWARLYV
ncbi:hypothetical protein VKT23_016740 [Stygiomarasmius scandens]|uniref:Uncharacterized protein n=1 Tax=Marasmiellus scandens TaxID=2682957 RepID=A0ABR1IW29_9AGAR